MSELSDNELKKLAVKMLPDQITFWRRSGIVDGQSFASMCLCWCGNINNEQWVRDTEMLAIAQMIEKAICDSIERLNYIYVLTDIVGPDRCAVTATWQQRITALARTKGLIK